MGNGNHAPENLNPGNSATSTVFSGFNQPVEDRSLIAIMNDIRNGKYKSDIERVRSCIASGDTEKADQLKKKLPAFTPSGTFVGGRKLELLKQYNGFVHLDFDKLKPEQLKDAFQLISQIPFTFACFRSPSGNGLKVFIEVNTTAEKHDIAYRQVQTYYETWLNIPSDPKCKDVTRLCFVSDDPDLFLNPDNQKFDVAPDAAIFYEALPNITSPPVAPTLPIQSSANDSNSQFEDCIRFTEQKEQYHDGNRNNYIYLLACNCNRKGISEDDARSQISMAFDLPDKEITASVKSAYQNHFADFAKFANSAKVANTIKTPPASSNPPEETHEDYLKNTPLIPDDLIDKLPVLLQSGANAFTDKRERDVFLTGAIAILSGCMSNVKGIYAQQTVYPNLFSFVIAPAASGKGALKFSKMLADKRHDLMKQSSIENRQRFETEMNEYKAHQRSQKKGESSEEPPQQPAFKVVFIPANSSYAKILLHLEQNEGEGIICETEADTMGNVLKQEWGGYSDMLRKAFHHERVSSSKKANNEYIEVNEPRLSVALSGTPNQVTGLISSAEDGLFSRFIFYAFKADQLWRDVSPYANNINLTDHFQNLSNEVYEMVMFLDRYPTTVELSRLQWDRLNEICSHWLYDVITFTSEDAGSVVKRLGLVLYRISMIFTTMRKFENGDTSNTVQCTDDDFETAMHLANLFLQHSLLMFHNLPKQDEATIFKSGDNKRKFFEALPRDFKRTDAIELGKKFNLSARSVDSLLKELLGHYLSQPQFGAYSKL